MSFKSKFFAGNRASLAKLHKDSIIVVSANGLIQASADTAFTFRQDSNFWYLTGLQLAEAILVIDTTSDEEILILPKRAPHRDQWEGEINSEEICKTSGIKEVLKYEEGWKVLKKLAAKFSKVTTMLAPEPYLDAFGMYANPARDVLCKKLKRLGFELADARGSLAQLRSIKQLEEIEAIKRAINITIAGFKELSRNYASCADERQAQQMLEAEFLRFGGDYLAYGSIVAAGKNAATIHYERNDQPINDGDMLLIDAGAKSGMYCADITRMFKPKSGLNKRQKEVIAAVQEVKKYAESLAKPKKDWREFNNDVSAFVAEKLVELRLIKNAKDSDKAFGYYPHSISHHMGIDVHDLADHNAVLAVGNVFTIEPGIYIPEENIGVRLEDNYYLSENGLENLSIGLPALL